MDNSTKEALSPLFPKALSLARKHPALARALRSLARALTARGNSDENLERASQVLMAAVEKLQGDDKSLATTLTDSLLSVKDADPDTQLWTGRQMRFYLPGLDLPSLAWRPSLTNTLALFTLIGGIWTSINILVLEPIQGQLEQAKDEAADLTNQLLSTSRTLESSEKSLAQISTNLSAPVLERPQQDANVTGRVIEFRWRRPGVLSPQIRAQPHHTTAAAAKSEYVLEARNLSNLNEPYLHQVVNPQGDHVHIPAHHLGYGETIWRVVPGTITNGKLVSNGVSSGWNLFTSHQTVVDRIAETKTLRVGTTPTFDGYFNFPLPDASVQGLDMEIAEWFAKKLNVELEIIPLGFAQLLPAIMSHDVDLVVSHMTRTKRRERENPGIKFSKSYFPVQPVFAARSQYGDFPTQLQGRIVGVMKGTTNDQAAEILSSELRFLVNRNFDDSEQIYAALERGEIDFVLVDDVMIDPHIKDFRFIQYGPKLGQILREISNTYYDEIIGFQTEGFGIAVLFEDSEDSLLTQVNEFLSDPNTKAAIKQRSVHWQEHRRSELQSK